MSGVNIYRNSNPLIPIIDIELLDTKEALWIDLYAPNAGEIAQVEAAYNIDIVTDDEAEIIEESARFYEEKNALYINLVVPARIGAVPYVPANDKAVYQRANLRVILTQNTLITYHQSALKALEIGKTRASVRIEGVKNASDALLIILEALVERQAVLLSNISQSLDNLSVPILSQKQLNNSEPRLRKMGQLGAQLGLCRDCLFDLGRLVSFLSENNHKNIFAKEKLILLKDDISDLLRQGESKTNDLSFLQDSTLAIVGARQSRALNFIAIVTLLFAPPTLIASIFGMNFSKWEFFNYSHGHLLSFVFMIVSALLVLIIAKIARLF